MNQKEARRVAERLRGRTNNYSDIAMAAIILDDRVAELEVGLQEIGKGKGAYDLDPLKHAANCIESMTSIAYRLLEAPHVE